MARLEQPCRDHEEYLGRRALGSGDNPEDALFSGHALMATCPPVSFVRQTPAAQGGLQNTYPHKVPDAPYQDLQTLLDLARKVDFAELALSGQVTPVNAYQALRSHHHYHLLTKEDIVKFVDKIKSYVHCYGFGAVMEDFELHDALLEIFAGKPEIYNAMNMQGDLGEDIEDMYS